MATFAFNNQSVGTSYVVLEIIPNSQQVIPAITPKYISGSVYSNFTGDITRDMIVENDYKLGIVVPEGNSSFDFDPRLTIPLSESIIRGAGECDLEFVVGATGVAISVEELNNSRTPLPEVPGGSTPPAGYNNQYSLFFDQTGAGVADKEFLETPVNAGLSPTNNFTISVWAKPYISDPPDDGTIFDNANSSNGYLLMHDDIGSGAWNFQIQKSGQTKRVRTSTVPVANTWQHILGVFTEGTGSIYINSVKRGEDTFTGETTVGVNTTQNPRIGTTQGSTIGTIDAYSGSLQNISIWGAAFNQAEIDEIYNGGTPTDLNNHSRVADGITWWQLGGNGESGSFAANWTELNCFNNAVYVMTSTNMDLANQVTDTP